MLSNPILFISGLIYFYTSDEWEFYEMKADPQEQRNLTGSTKHQEEITGMKKALMQSKMKYKDVEPADEVK